MRNKSSDQKLNKKCKEYATLFYVTYHYNGFNKIFFSPFLKGIYKKYNLVDPLDIVDICYRKKEFKLKELLLEKEKASLDDAVLFLFEKNLDYISNISDSFYQIEIENEECIVNTYFFNKIKIKKSTEKKNNSDFLAFLKYCIFLQRLKKDKFLEIFKDAKIVKIKIKKDLDHHDFKTLQKGLHFHAYKSDLVDYLNKFQEITKKYDICPLKMSNENICCIGLKHYANNISTSNTVLNTLNMQDMINEDLLQKSFMNFENNLYGEIFKRFIDFIVTLKISLGNQIFSYEKGISFIFNIGNNDEILKKIEDYKNVIKGEKKNLKRLVIHNSSQFITFFTILLKNKNSDLEDFLYTLGILDNSLKMERLSNGKVFHRISSSYDLSFIKEMILFLD